MAHFMGRLIAMGDVIKSFRSCASSLLATGRAAMGRTEGVHAKLGRAVGRARERRDGALAGDGGDVDDEAVLALAHLRTVCTVRGCARCMTPAFTTRQPAMRQAPGRSDLAMVDSTGAACQPGRERGGGPLGWGGLIWGGPQAGMRAPCGTCLQPMKHTTRGSTGVRVSAQFPLSEIQSGRIFW